MGAAHSKKRRKEKKRHRTMSSSGLLSGDFDIPRSASVDVIRTLSVSPAASCPHCRGLSNKRALSTPLEGQLDQSQDFLDSTGVDQRCSVPRSFSDALTRQQCHHCCSLAYGHTGMGDSYPGVATTLSHECLLPRDYRAQTTTAAMFETSTMSLNRNLAGRQSSIVQSGSAEFRELESDFYSSHDRREKSIELTPKRSASFSPSSPREGRVFEPCRGGSERMIDTFSPALPSSSSNPAAPSIVLTAPSPRELRQSNTDSETQPETKESGSKLSLLDDEPSRLARWEKRKLMAQQLRMLRKHIQAQEEASSRSNPTPMPRPPLSLLNINRSDENTAPKEFETPLPVSSHSQTFQNNEPLPKMETKVVEPVAAPAVPQRRSTRSKFSKMSNYRYLDNHPVLSKLQNEQNNRLESMERRMRDIKLSAMQEAERRRFAEIFPAKDDNSESEKLRLMQEARETLEVLKEEKKRKVSNQESADSRSHSSTTESNTQTQGTGTLDTLSSLSDSGEVIPVRVVPSTSRDGRSQSKELPSRTTQGHSRTSSSGERLCKQNSTEKKADWLNEVWPNINLGQPFTWLFLPFMVFPVVLRMLLSFIITTTAPNPNNSTNSTNNTANTKGVTSKTSSIRDKSSPDLIRRRRYEEVKNGN